MDGAGGKVQLEAPAREGVAQLGFGGVQAVESLTEAVSEEGERSLGGDGEVLLAQRSGSGVARVGEGLASGGPLGGVESEKVGLTHEDLAVDLDVRRCILDPQGQLADCAGLSGHVLARRVVAAGGGLRQVSVLVEEGAGEPVDLGFSVEGEIGDGDPGRLGQAFCPGSDVFRAVGVVEGEHRDGVRDGGEGVVETAADASDAGAEQVGVLAVQDVETDVPDVIGGIVDDGGVAEAVGNIGLGALDLEIGALGMGIGVLGKGWHNRWKMGAGGWSVRGTGVVLCLGRFVLLAAIPQWPPRLQFPRLWLSSRFRQRTRVPFRLSPLRVFTTSISQVAGLSGLGGRIASRLVGHCCCPRTEH